jgi:hypothetical protein
MSQVTRQIEEQLHSKKPAVRRGALVKLNKMIGTSEPSADVALLAVSALGDDDYENRLLAADIVTSLDLLRDDDLVALQGEVPGGELPAQFIALANLTLQMRNARAVGLLKQTILKANEDYTLMMALASRFCDLDASYPELRKLLESQLESQWPEIGAAAADALYANLEEESVEIFASRLVLQR